MSGRSYGVLLFGVALVACPKPSPVGHHTPPAEGVIVTCPVTRASCAKGPETLSSVLDERTYYFCTEEAWARFQAHPERFGDPR